MKTMTQLESLTAKIYSAGSSETALNNQHKKQQQSCYNKAKRLAKKIGGRIEIERYGNQSSYWVFGPDKVEKHPEWCDDEHFQTCWVGVYDFLNKVADFIKKRNL